MIDRLEQSKFMSVVVRYRTLLIVLVQGGLITVSYLAVVLFRLDMGVVPVSSDATV